MGIKDLFGSKAPEVQTAPEDLALAPRIAGARGIVSRDDSQQKDNVAAVCAELNYTKQRHLDHYGH